MESNRSLPLKYKPPLADTFAMKLKQILESDDFSCSDAESIQEYAKHGFHPVYLGETFCNGKYETIQKLGWGTFSTVRGLH
jgi:hypothetical protein